MNESKQELLNRINTQLTTTNIEEIRKRGNSLKFPIYLNQEISKTDIADLELSVRSYNCLKRAGFSQIGDLVDHIDKQEDLLRIRNLGRKSAEEIMLNLMLYQYSVLKPERQKGYVERIKVLNHCK